MKLLNKDQFIRLMEDTPEGGIVFAEYIPDIITSDLMVLDSGGFGARNVIPGNGEVFDWDWSIGDYSSNDMFIIFDNNDVLQMIQTLTSGLKIKLEDY